MMEPSGSARRNVPRPASMTKRAPGSRGDHTLRGRAATLVQCGIAMRPIRRRLVEEVPLGDLELIGNMRGLLVPSRGGTASYPDWLVEENGQQLRRVRPVLPGHPGDERRPSLTRQVSR